MSGPVGIDLGTTYTAIAHVNEAGLPEILPNAEGDKITPSVVYFEHQTAIVGSVAREALATDPENAVQLVKRQMGSNWTFTHGGIEYRAEQISALILKKVIQDAEAVVGPIEEAVITVPAYFNDAMRNATKVAGEIAGVRVLGLINEPTAAAIAFGLQKNVGDSTILAYDLGGGTFDITVMQVEGADLNVLACGGDHFLGGANFDKKLYDHFVGSFRQRLGIDLHDPKSVDVSELVLVAQEFLRKAERLKRDLTMRTHASTSLSALGHTMKVEVTRSDFEQMCRVLLEETKAKVWETVADAGIGIDDVSFVLLVGGATRMPMIRDQVSKMFRAAPNTSVNPDEAVAIGAALYCANRALRQGSDLAMPRNRVLYLRRMQVTDVASHSLGVRAFDRLPSEGGVAHNSIILRKNSPLPSEGSQAYYTSYPGQTSIAIEILEGEEEDIDLCRSIAKLQIVGLPPGRAIGMPVAVTIRYNEDGILEVEAIDEQTGMRAHTTIMRSAGLSSEQQEEATAIVEHLVVE